MLITAATAQIKHFIFRSNEIIWVEETSSWSLPWPKPVTAMAGLAAMGQEDLVLKKDKNVLVLLNMWDRSKDQEYVEVIDALLSTKMNN